MQKGQVPSPIPSSGTSLRGLAAAFFVYLVPGLGERVAAHRRAAEAGQAESAALDVYAAPIRAEADHIIALRQWDPKEGHSAAIKEG